MQFTKININNWTRKEYFDHYFGNTPCTYSMTVKLDISKLKRMEKSYTQLFYMELQRSSIDMKSSGPH